MNVLRAAAALALVWLAPEAARAAGDGGSVGADLAWRTANLLLLLGLLWALGRKPIQGFFRDRRHRIEGELESAAQLRRQAEKRYAEFQRRLADLDGEIGQIRERARERAAAEGERIVADARGAAERIRREARLAVEQELRRARRELRDEAADLSIELAGRMLRERVSEEDRDRLLDEFIGTIEGGNGSGAER